MGVGETRCPQFLPEREQRRGSAEAQSVASPGVQRGMSEITEQTSLSAFHVIRAQKGKRKLSGILVWIS